jgi:site-specific DNA-methyltransferase (adenine-specific)
MHREGSIPRIRSAIRNHHSTAAALRSLMARRYPPKPGPKPKTAREPHALSLLKSYRVSAALRLQDCLFDALTMAGRDPTAQVSQVVTCLSPYSRSLKWSWMAKRAERTMRGARCQRGPALEENRIHNVDCFEGMKNIPNQSVDMILTDLPYGVTNNVWDSPLNLDRLWAEYKRIIRPRRAIVLTARCPFDKVLGMSNINWLRYEWIWEKPTANGFLDVRRAPLRAHENILVFSEQTALYQPQLAEGKPYVSKRGPFSLHNLGRNLIGNVIVNRGSRYPRSVLRIATERYRIHPTQKPVALFEYLIRTYTHPGELVLDTCIGSGTTAIACMNSGRRFIGFESDTGYFRRATARIRNCGEESGLLNHLDEIKP